MTIRKVFYENQELNFDEAKKELFCIDVNEEAKVDVSDIADVEIRERVESLVANYEPNMSRDVVTDVEMTIILRDEEPVYQRPRRLSPSEKADVDSQIKEWLETGIIRPSNSDFASPIVLVRKKNGEIRICVDYRKLNEKIIKDRYPLPLIEDQLNGLQRAKFFSTIDLKNGFFHVPVGESSKKYTSFVVPNGQYEFNFVPFGLCNSPAVFQRYINAVFRQLIVENVVEIYLDDIIIPSPDLEVGVERLERVMNIAAQAGLRLNWSKCQFLKTKINYLGHIVEDGMVQPSTEKVKAVVQYPELKSIKDVQRFLGLTGYFRKFVFKYSEIAKPLSDLLRGDRKFVFGDREREAFKLLKDALSKQPVLRLYTHRAITELHTDASIAGYGAILMQKSFDGDDKFHPVYYASGKTTAAEEKYCSYELEVLAIVKALEKLRVYLLGRFFTIVTDCQAFVKTMNKKNLCVRVARWALALEEFEYSIKHRPGKLMSHVDALSRSPVPEVFIVTECHDSVLARFKKTQETDEELLQLIQLAKANRANICCEE